MTGSKLVLNKSTFKENLSQPAKKIVATIEARMGSSRLPGKVLKKFHSSTVLGFMVERLCRSLLISEIVVATSTESNDDAILNFCDDAGIKCYRGSEQDVLARVYYAADANKADVVVTLTGDCPLIDPEIVDQMIAGFFANKVDYHTNTIKRSYPDGMDVQVMTFSTLKKAFELSSDAYDREHVTPYIYNNPNLFKISHQISPPNLYWPELGLTLDEQLDYVFLNNLIAEFTHPTETNCGEFISMIKNNPKIFTNSAVIRK